MIGDLPRTKMDLVDPDQVAGFKAAVEDEYIWHTGAHLRNCQDKSPAYHDGYEKAMSLINQAHKPREKAALLSKVQAS